jgi:hypothetical protein
MYAPYPGVAPAAPKSSAIRNIVILVAIAAAGYGGYRYYLQKGSTVTIGTKDEVIYSGQATKDQATALGNALKTAGYFQDRGVSVLLKKTSSSTTIGYVVQDGVWDKPDMVSDFEVITRGVASTVGGLPIDMQLDNSTETVEKDEVVTAQPDATPTPPANTTPTPPADTTTTSTVTIGTKDQIIYSGSATQAQATALGNALKQAGYLQDRGVTVLLSVGASGAVISYVVQDGVWNNPTMVTDFEIITRGVASTVGGLPIDMRLVNSAEVVEKDEVVNAQ